ncbi:MAG TPA: family 16 glycoside hydrolase, partial [Verrucomicrobiae bacterium]
MGVETSRAAEAVSLFDGKSLAGWDADPKFWKVEAGLIVGGNGDAKMPHNDFLATVKSFHNFDLRVKLRLTGDPKTGMINSGVQIRSVRVPGGHEMSGYQVDYGVGWHGKLYDESRRNKVIADSTDPKAATAAIREGDWNEYRIRADGPRIRSWINGVPALDYTEPEPDIAQDGRIGIQVHGGGVARVEVKEIFIEELPATPNAPTWEKLGGYKPRPKPAAPKSDEKKKAEGKAPKRDISYNAIVSGPQTPEEERKSFTLPPGFEIELVAAESEGIGKFITTVWDAKMRLWTMTALEYPVDANENKAASDALFARGGRDKVLVFDDVYTSEGRATRVPIYDVRDSRSSSLRGLAPRTFADGLVMPLGLLPYRDGAFVQYGPDIRFYRDTDGDGRADKHEVILTGFGTQDSHLFPHQFTRAPGGWVFVAQGAFNFSKVHRPGDKPFADGATEVSFNNCKLARFQLDGSLWENVTAGPQNIWGFTISREGETFMQEANDMGYPVIPYEPGIHVKTGSKERLRPYQPLMPGPLNPPQMGGTGLSGLALADDRDTPFRKHPTADAGSKIFYLANPITSAINTVKATPDGPRYRYEKLADFMTTTDRWFRPVAIAFGPDGCLYITDWYNKIISHNEVPRNHPYRDKTRGRIWRVRHKDQPRVAPPDLAKLSEKELLAQLGGPSALISRLAWLEIIDRNATVLAPELEKIIADKSAPADRRLGAMWALEGLKTIPTATLQMFAADTNENLRHEAARLAASQPRFEGEFLAVAAPLITDPHPRVRAAIGDALRRVPNASPRVMALAAMLGREPLAIGTEWEKYAREFERYLARWAMEVNPQSTAALLNSPEGRALPLENRLLATLALGGKESAIGLAKLVPELKRPLGDEEVRALAAHFGEPAVSDALSAALANENSRAPVLRALLNLRTSLDTTKLTTALTAAAKSLLAGNNVAELELGAEVAGAFKLARTEPDLVALLLRGRGRFPRETPNQSILRPESFSALRALRELGSGPLELFEQLARDAADALVRDAAVAALGASKAPDASERLVKLLPKLSPTQRGNALDRLAGSKAGATALIAGLQSGAVARADVGLNTVERLRVLLPNNAGIAALWKELGGDAKRALRLNGGKQDFADTKLALDGPFTVECWAKLDANIGNQDGILGAPGQLSVNYFNSQLRVWIKGASDIVVANKKTTPQAWTHYAVTRDDAGVFRIFINGELDATSTKTSTERLTGLNVGRTTVNTGGTAGWLAEYRIWNVARSAKEIRENFDRSFQGETKPAGLMHHFSGANWGKL